MREIKFRAQDKVNKKWIYGNLEIPLLTQSKSKHYILGYSYGQYQKHEVESKTVGQYIGLSDINGMKIYEGDIVRLFVPTDPEMPEYISKVFDYHGAYTVKCEGMDIYNDHFVMGWIEEYEFEIIGNVHRNPELVKS
ncbi:YopX family protein [Lysinibacillus sp. NPDC086135]|uniref:YopX family protein n=1 Tax=Lysinibacillus sp. NPDC086135 TaxID=3364130 RepID=UPI0038154B52